MFDLSSEQREKEERIKALQRSIKKQQVIGTLSTRGRNDGNVVYMGPQGGIFYFTKSSHNQVYLKMEYVLHNVILSI